MCLYFCGIKFYCTDRSLKSNMIGIFPELGFQYYAKVKEGRVKSHVGRRLNSSGKLRMQGVNLSRNNINDQLADV